MRPSFLLPVYPFDKMVSGGEVVEVVCLPKRHAFLGWSRCAVWDCLVAGFAYSCVAEVELAGIRAARVCVPFFMEYIDGVPLRLFRVVGCTTGILWMGREGFAVVD